MAMMKVQCLSHTPLMGLCDPSPHVVDEVRQTLLRLRNELLRFDPEVIFLFAPDHFNGFFYDLMPPFCIGVRAESVGDYETSSGPLQVPSDIAEACVRAVLSADVDCAVSYRMQVDHGFAQPLELLTGALDRYPVVPIFINSVAAPLPSFRRARLLGQAVGHYAATLNKRVLFMGSGGLSHNPPVPTLRGATPEIAERLICGRNPGAQARAERQSRVLAAAREFATGQSMLQPLNPQWDRQFLSALENQDFEWMDAWSNDALSSIAGASVHEVKSWVAANAAMHAATRGSYVARSEYYEAIPEWIAGFGVLQGQSSMGATLESIEVR